MIKLVDVHICEDGQVFVAFLALALRISVGHLADGCLAAAFGRRY